MKLLISTVAVLAAVCLSGAAAAQTAATARPDPVRLQLAREVLEASGGVQAYQARIKGMFGAMSELVKSNMPSGQAGISDVMFKYLQEEEVKAVPQLLEDFSDIYAEHLTETELRDLLAWTNSPSGRSIRDKTPQITQELMLRQGPLLKQMMAGMMEKTVERTCAETHCTPDQRQQLVATMSKALAPAPS